MASISAKHLNHKLLV